MSATPTAAAPMNDVTAMAAAAMNDATAWMATATVTTTATRERGTNCQKEHDARQSEKTHGSDPIAFWMCA